MVKIVKSGNQYKISIPKEIIEMKNWDDEKEVMFVPFLNEAEKEIDEDTPIILKEVNKK
ncbi:MAG: hypothetical protein ABEI78_01985 [Candidatus Nanohaloarchaea archaeon]